MNRSIATAIVLLAGMPSLAMADCSSTTRVTGAALNALVNGNTVCASRGADKWQEQHRAGGQLWDYKMGPGHPIDPSKQVGTWNIARNFVTYCYTGDKCYSYSVHGPFAGNTYNFCSANGQLEVSGATFKNGEQGCP
jgi:hypothetical protein